MRAIFGLILDRFYAQMLTVHQLVERECLPEDRVHWNCCRRPAMHSYVNFHLLSKHQIQQSFIPLAGNAALGIRQLLTRPFLVQP